MNKYIKKLNVSETQFQELIHYSTKIQEVAYNIYPEIEKAATWAVCDNYYSYALILKEDRLHDYSIPLLTWSKISSFIPKLKDFISHWDLIPAYGTGTTQVNVHRHIKPTYSNWTITLFQENTKGGFVKIHKPLSDHKYDDNAFEFVKDEVSEVIELEEVMDDNLVYSIYSKMWHSWEISKTQDTMNRYSLFQFNNSSTVESIKYHLNRLKINA